MAFVVHRPHGFALTEKVRDSAGKWRNRDICSLGHAESVEAALLQYGDDLEDVEREMASWEPWERKSFAYTFRQLEKRAALQRDRIKKLRTYLKSTAEAAGQPRAAQTDGIE